MLRLALCVASALAAASGAPENEDVILDNADVINNDANSDANNDRDFSSLPARVCQDEVMLAKMDLGQCDQDRYVAFSYKTLHGSTTSMAYECTARCLMQIYRQRLERAGVDLEKTTTSQPWTRADCYDRDKLREMGLQKGKCLLFLGEFGDFKPSLEEDQMEEEEAGEERGRIPVYVYRGHRFSTHTLYIFFIVLIVTCSCCGGFFRCKRPNAPNLYSYLEARADSTLTAARLRRRRISDASLVHVVANDSNVIAFGGASAAAVPIPTYEEAVNNASEGNSNNKPPEFGNLPAMPPSYEEAVGLTSSQAQDVEVATTPAAAGANSDENNAQG